MYTGRPVHVSYCVYAAASEQHPGHLIKHPIYYEHASSPLVHPRLSERAFTALDPLLFTRLCWGVLHTAAAGPDADGNIIH